MINEIGKVHRGCRYTPSSCLYYDIDHVVVGIPTLCSRDGRVPGIGSEIDRHMYGNFREFHRR